MLREVERGLALPIPDRVRILRELEYDLEELRDLLVTGGLAPDVARHRALRRSFPIVPPCVHWTDFTHPGTGGSLGTSPRIV